MKAYVGLGLLFLISWMGQAKAQISNGDFSGSAIAWDWSWKVSEKAFDTCEKAQDYHYFAPNRHQTPDAGYHPAYGRVALITPGHHYGSGSYIVCGRIEQVVKVPHEARLNFVTRVGDILLSSLTMTRDAYLSVRVIDMETNKLTRMFRIRGSSRSCPITRPQCVKYYSYGVDMSEFGGKTVKIIFQGESSYKNSTTGSIYPSSVYIDNVVLK